MTGRGPNMRRALFASLIVVALFSNLACSRRQNRGDEWVQSKPVAREAEPVRNWLQSIKARDVELFKTVFSNNLLGHFERQGWGRMLGVYTNLWTEKLGDFDIDEITFEFAPFEGTNTGLVTVIRSEKRYPPINVIFEEGSWKVNEL